MPISDELKNQIDAGFDFRGHVTITFEDGKTLDGYLYNRIYKTDKLSDGDYIEVYPKDSDASRRFPMESLRSIELSGKNFAESYDDFLKRTGGKT
ncbi:MAG: hypothetical protein AUJ52_10095 [Elusimicrobia bacterium CG1_02_63_36]|nr:MAG: hypothetical protein AUJ52_10095 [Elusimicrobia bacterium CG1_02_63_36]PIP84072.1 MAG: hypothetical protein COR54_06030 [Elusimicrobia bacterium CG22_combo_CG10-13_8_21_14_all_63_91]PJA15081.1 MAG: hypothetical protein COX66_10915 [Elusimicrobia bacterium CG_4_10_14_0_2_um_filter_63_34]PJB23489.1 MAG: hypothetical protein CO113_17905 [Elusimicrobia bacterium CG_4_9_14_3_um_filter_62_55]